MQKYVILVEKEFKKISKSINYQEVRNHYHYTGYYRDAAHSIFNIKFNVPNEILDLLTDTDMLLMVKKGIREEICHAIYRYAKANNKYMKDYDKNE